MKRIDILSNNKCVLLSEYFYRVCKFLVFVHSVLYKMKSCHENEEQLDFLFFFNLFLLTKQLCSLF